MMYTLLFTFAAINQKIESKIRNLIERKLSDLEALLKVEWTDPEAKAAKIESMFLGILKGLAIVKKPEFLKMNIDRIIEQVRKIQRCADKRPKIWMGREDFFAKIINKGCGTQLYELIQNKLKERDFEFFVFVLGLSKHRNFYSFRERMMRESILKCAHEEFLDYILKHFKKLIKNHDPQVIGPRFEKKDFVTLWLNLFYQLIKHNQFYTSQERPLQKMQELNLFISYNFIVAEEQNLKTVIFNPFYSEQRVMKRLLLKTFQQGSRRLVDLYQYVQIVAKEKYFWWPRLLQKVFSGDPAQDARALADLLLYVLPGIFAFRDSLAEQHFKYYWKRKNAFIEQLQHSKNNDSPKTFQVFLAKLVVPYLAGLKRPLPGQPFLVVFKLIHDIVQALTKEKGSSQTRVSATAIQEFLKINLELLRHVTMPGPEAVSQYMVSIFTFFWSNIVNPWDQAKDLPILCKLIISELIRRHDKYLQRVSFTEVKCKELYQSVIMDINDTEFDEYYQAVWMDACSSIVPYMKGKADLKKRGPDAVPDWLEIFQKGHVHTSEEFSEESKLSVKSSFWIFIVGHKKLFLEYLRFLLTPGKLLDDISKFISNGKHSKLIFNIFLMLLTHFLQVKHRLRQARASDLAPKPNSPSELTFHNFREHPAEDTDRAWTEKLDSPEVKSLIFFKDFKDSFADFRDKLLKLFFRYLLSYPKEPLLPSPDSCYLFGLLSQTLCKTNPLRPEDLADLLKKKFNLQKISEDAGYRKKIIDSVRAQFDLFSSLLRRGKACNNLEFHGLIREKFELILSRVGVVVKNLGDDPSIYFSVFELLEETLSVESAREFRESLMEKEFKNFTKVEILTKDERERKKRSYPSQKFVVNHVLISLSLKHRWGLTHFTCEGIQKMIDHLGNFLADLANPHRGYVSNSLDLLTPADELLEEYAGLKPSLPTPLRQSGIFEQKAPTKARSSFEYLIVVKSMLLNLVRLFTRVYQLHSFKKMEQFKTFLDRIIGSLNMDDKKYSALSFSLDMNFRLQILRTLRPILEEFYYQTIRKIKSKIDNQRKHKEYILYFKQLREKQMFSLTPKKTILDRLPDEGRKQEYFAEYLDLLDTFLRDEKYEWERAEYFLKNLLVNLVQFLDASNRARLFRIMRGLIRGGTRDTLDFFFDRKFIKNKSLSIFIIEDLIRAFVIFEVENNRLDCLSLLQDARTLSPFLYGQHVIGPKFSVLTCPSQFFSVETRHSHFGLERLVEIPYFFGETCDLFSQILLGRFRKMGPARQKEFLFYIEDIFCSTSKHYVLDMSHLVEFLPAMHPEFLHSSLFFNFHGDYSAILARIKLMEQTLESPKLLLSPNFPQMARAFDKAGSSHLRNKPLEILKTTYGLEEQYAELLSTVGREDHQATVDVLLEISSSLPDLTVDDYEDAVLDQRLSELYHEAQTQLSTWESFTFLSQLYGVYTRVFCCEYV